MKKMLTAASLVLFVAGAVGAATDKQGNEIQYNPSGENQPSTLRADWEYNTAGTIDAVPTTGGSADGWGEYFITTILNDTGQDLNLVELGFPCSGPPTDTYGWVIWTGMGGIMPPAGDPFSADHFGPFTPVDSDPGSFPPLVYTYIDISSEGIVIPAGEYFCVGYDNTGNGGQIEYNGVQTWAWYTGFWDPDESWGRTAVIQVKGDFGGGTPVESASWTTIKSLY